MDYWLEILTKSRQVLITLFGNFFGHWLTALGWRQSQKNSDQGKLLDRRLKAFDEIARALRPMLAESKHYKTNDPVLVFLVQSASHFSQVLRDLKTAFAEQHAWLPDETRVATLTLLDTISEVDPDEHIRLFAASSKTHDTAAKLHSKIVADVQNVYASMSKESLLTD